MKFRLRERKKERVNNYPNPESNLGPTLTPTSACLLTIHLATSLEDAIRYLKCCYQKRHLIGPPQPQRKSPEALGVERVEQRRLVDEKKE